MGLLGGEVNSSNAKLVKVTVRIFDNNSFMDNNWFMSFLYNLFIPHHGNDHRAGLLKPQILSFLTLIFVLSQVSLNLFSLKAPQVLGYSSNISPERIIELTNVKRAAAGLPPLKENSLLSEAARRKAGDMFAFNYWAHVSPSGRNPWAFFKEVGYNYVYAGENLARDFRDPDSVINAWMNSSSHKDNIMSEKYQEIGVAVVDGSLQETETTLVVQLFGSVTRAVAGKKTTSPSKQTGSQMAGSSSTKKLGLQMSGASTKVTGQSGEIVANSEGKFRGQINRQINPFSVNKILVGLLVGIIIGTFVFDLILVSKKTPRLSSHSFAQLLFLGFILLIIVISKQGVII